MKKGIENGDKMSLATIKAKSCNQVPFHVMKQEIKYDDKMLKKPCDQDSSNILANPIQPPFQG